MRPASRSGSPRRRSGAKVWLQVEDAGPGVAATALPHLFERFYRAPRRQGSRSEGGSGIGLAVVKGLADAMGGSAFARPSTLGGLEVVVRLPVEVEPEVEPAPEGAAEPEVEPALEPDGAPKAAEPNAAEPAPEPDGAPKAAEPNAAEPAPEPKADLRPASRRRSSCRTQMSDGAAVVLIVEDDEPARAAIASNLRARGHEVDEAGDVREALRLWDCRRPDLILLDLDCPTSTARP